MCNVGGGGKLSHSLLHEKQLSFLRDVKEIDIAVHSTSIMSTVANKKVTQELIHTIITEFLTRYQYRSEAEILSIFSRRVVSADMRSEIRSQA